MEPPKSSYSFDFVIYICFFFIFCLDFGHVSSRLMCGNGFSASSDTRCLYKIDKFGHIVGCRSLMHLQKCGK